jgi:hypothetical protein
MGPEGGGGGVGGGEGPEVYNILATAALETHGVVFMFCTNFHKFSPVKPMKEFHPRPLFGKSVFTSAPGGLSQFESKLGRLKLQFEPV